MGGRMGDREELESLRRLDELERRAAPQTASPSRPRTQPGMIEKAAGFINQNKRYLPGGMVGEGLNTINKVVDEGAYDLGGAVTDKTGSPAAGYLTNVATQSLPALIGGGASSGIKSIMQKPAERLMQSAIKPSMADRESGKAAQAIRTMLDEGINPTSGGMDKASDLVRGLHEKVEKTIAPSTAEVSISDIGQKYLPQYEKALSQANPDADIKAVGGVWNEFANSPLVGGQETIPIQLAHLLKRGTQQAVGGKAYGELGSTSTEAQKTLARLLREGVAEAEPGVVESLKREAAIMNVKNVAQNAVMRDGNKDLIGISALADNPYMMATSMADRWGALKGMGAQALHTAGKPRLAIPAAVASDEYVQADKQRMADYLRKRAQ